MQRSGKSASFTQLFDANASKLAEVWPGEHGDYDASSADSSLASHLMFWTGRNMERTRRIMLLSGLRREKWEREDYLPRTIRGVYQLHVDNNSAIHQRADRAPVAIIEQAKSLALTDTPETSAACCIGRNRPQPCAISNGVV